MEQITLKRYNKNPKSGIIQDRANIKKLFEAENPNPLDPEKTYFDALLYPLSYQPYVSNVRKTLWDNNPSWITIEKYEHTLKFMDNVYTFSSELKELYEELESSKYILELPDNWDDEGAKQYKKETWLRMLTFLHSQAIYILNNFHKVLLTPKISHGPEGSIDLYWDYDDCDLLLNIPAEKDSLTSFFGEDKNSNNIRGLINLDNPPKHILLCLTK